MANEDPSDRFGHRQKIFVFVSLPHEQKIPFGKGDPPIMGRRQGGETEVYDFNLVGVDSENSDNIFFRVFRDGDDPGSPLGKPLFICRYLRKGGKIMGEYFMDHIVDGQNKGPVRDAGHKIRIIIGRVKHIERMASIGEPSDHVATVDEGNKPIETLHDMFNSPVSQRIDCVQIGICRKDNGKGDFKPVLFSYPPDDLAEVARYAAISLHAEYLVIV